MNNVKKVRNLWIKFDHEIDSHRDELIEKFKELRDAGDKHVKIIEVIEWNGDRHMRYDYTLDKTIYTHSRLSFKHIIIYKGMIKFGDNTWSHDLEVEALAEVLDEINSILKK